MSDTKMIKVRGTKSTTLERLQLAGCPGCGKRDMIEAVHLGESLCVVECIRCGWQMVAHGLYNAVRKWGERTVIPDVAGMESEHVWYSEGAGHDV